jgi:hypothetical protein
VIVVNDPPKGGQVPLLKHAIMVWLQTEHAKTSGRIHGDTYSVAEATRGSVTNVHRALWDLQKQGLITFRERKGEGSNGHGSTTILTHFTLTQRGIGWTSDKSAVEDFAADITREDLNPAMVAEIDAERMAAEVRRAGAHAKADVVVARAREANDRMPPPQCTCGYDAGTVLRKVEHLRDCPWAQAMSARAAAVNIAAEALVKGVPAEVVASGIESVVAASRAPLDLTGLTPPNALATFLRHTGHPVRILDANLRLGYARESTAIYSLIRLNPGIFRNEGGKVSFIGPEDWVAPVKDKAGRTLVHHRPPRIPQTPLVREAIASVALDHDPEEGTQSLPPVTLHLPSLGPEITSLMTRAGKRAKVAEAVAALEAAGLDDDALTVMGRIPDDTTLEREVLALVQALGYAPHV